MIVKHRKFIWLGVITTIILLSLTSACGALNIGIGNAIEVTEAVLYGIWIAFLALYAMDELRDNIVNVILMNPPVTDPFIYDLLRFFIQLLYPLYVLAIIVTGVYIIFISSSPEGRVRSKNMFVKLIIGMGLLTASPHILHLILDSSQAIASAILAQIDLDPAFAVLSGGFVFLLTIFYMSLGFPSIFNLAVVGASPAIVAKLGSVIAAQTLAGKHVHTLLGLRSGFKGVKVTFRLEGAIPWLGIMMLFMMGLYLALLFRYIMVMLCILVFPFTILFYSFELTKGLGRTMLEQTLLWIFLQVFNAITLVSLAIGMNMMDPSSGLFNFPTSGYSTMVFFAGMIMVMYMPILMLQVFSRLFP